MKSFIYLILFLTLIKYNIYCQEETENRYKIDFIKNTENLNGSSDEEEGLVMTFDFYNKDKRIGNGGGWLIYKNGTKAAEMLVNKLYPNYNIKGIVFIKDLLNVKQRNLDVDTTMLREFDIYLYIVDAKYLEIKMNTDGEGAGRTYSYYNKYPLNIVVYKQASDCEYFIEIETYHVNNEEEYFKTLKLISAFRSNTAIESN